MDVLNIGPDVVDMTWTRPCEEWPVDFYRLTLTDVDSGVVDVTQFYECIDDVCLEELISGLRSCVTYLAGLTAFENGGALGHFNYSGEVFGTLESGTKGIRNVYSCKCCLSSQPCDIPVRDDKDRDKPAASLDPTGSA